MNPNINPLRALQSQDSLGREWDAAISAGDDGMISILQGQIGRDVGYDFPSSQSTSTSEHPSFNFDGSFDHIPTMLTENYLPPQPLPIHPPHISPAELSLALDHSIPYPTPISPNFQITTRPPSSTSNSTTPASASGSECSYSATDVSGDMEMDELPELELGKMGLKGEKTWTQYDQDNKGGVGPVRRTSGGRDTDKLEHRRSINRKSAQKHRARRKEELEVLTIAIAERDSRIAQLEKELAVERAKSEQLLGFVKGHQVASAPASRSVESEGKGLITGDKAEIRRTRGKKD